MNTILYVRQTFSTQSLRGLRPWLASQTVQSSPDQTR